MRGGPGGQRRCPQRTPVFGRTDDDRRRRVRRRRHVGHRQGVGARLVPVARHPRVVRPALLRRERHPAVAAALEVVVVAARLVAARAVVDCPEIGVRKRPAPARAARQVELVGPTRLQLDREPVVVARPPDGPRGRAPDRHPAGGGGVVRQVRGALRDACGLGRALGGLGHRRPGLVLLVLLIAFDDGRRRRGRRVDVDPARALAHPVRVAGLDAVGVGRAGLYGIVGVGGGGAARVRHQFTERAPDIVLAHAPQDDVAGDAGVLGVVPGEDHLIVGRRGGEARGLGGCGGGAPGAGAAVGVAPARVRLRRDPGVGGSSTVSV